MCSAAVFITCSLCDLRTHLAVEVYGVQPVVPLTNFVVTVIATASIVTALIGVFIARDMRIRRAINDDVEISQLEVFKSLVDR